MNENPFELGITPGSKIESEIEAFPTLEEVRSFIMELIAEREYEEEYEEGYEKGQKIKLEVVSNKEDEKGLHSLEIRITERLSGEATSYSYDREGYHGEFSHMIIDKIYFERNGEVSFAEPIAQYNKGEWKIT